MRGGVLTRLWPGVGRLSVDLYGFGGGGTLLWEKSVGDRFGPNDLVAILELDKICVEVRGETCGIKHEVIMKKRLMEQDAEFSVDCRALDLFEYDDIQERTEEDVLTEDDVLTEEDVLVKNAIELILEGGSKKALTLLQERFDGLGTRAFVAAVAHRVSGDIVAARTALDKVIATSTSLDQCVALERANLAFLERNFDEAKRVWSSVIEKKDSDIARAAYYSLAVMALDQGDLDDASKYCGLGLSGGISSTSSLAMRLESLATQIRELNVAPGMIMIRQSNAPIVTVFPISLFKTDTFVISAPPIDTAKQQHSASWDDIVRTVRGARSIVAITGSGISVGSGLKTRQDLWQSGLWDRDKSVNIVGHHDDPDAIWSLVHAFLADADPITLSPKPAASHVALAQLERMGKIKAIVTQNVDSLHQEAGSLRVIEMHGSLQRLRPCCAAWTAPVTSSSAFILSGKRHCKNCGSLPRPDVVLFGELVPQSVYNAAKIAVLEEADVLLVAGTALDVAPTSNLVALFAKSGKPIIEIAKAPSLFTHRFGTMFVGEDADIVLPCLVRDLQ